MKLVDPDGREIGDYYNTKGDYLGWDGVSDDNVFIVSDKRSEMRIINNTKCGDATRQESVDIILSTNYRTLSMVESVLNMAISDQGMHEFAISLNSGGYSLQSIQLIGETGGTLPTDPAAMNTSIHSHQFHDDVFDHWCENMSRGANKDAGAFPSYSMNVIVGESSKYSSYSSYEYGASFYDGRETTNYQSYAPFLTLSQKALHRIANGQMDAILSRINFNEGKTH